jgi:hypothetical protein
MVHIISECGASRCGASDNVTSTHLIEFALEEWVLESAPADAIDVADVLETAEELVAEGTAIYRSGSLGNRAFRSRSSIEASWLGFAKCSSHCSVVR